MNTRQATGGSWPKTFGGNPVPPNPGKSLVPVFRKDFTVSHDYFWFLHEESRAIRVGDWKLVALKNPQPAWELYDLSTDRCESNNLAANHPEKVKELEQAWTKHTEEFRELAKQDMPPIEEQRK